MPETTEEGHYDQWEALVSGDLTLLNETSPNFKRLKEAGISSESLVISPDSGAAVEAYIAMDSAQASGVFPSLQQRFQRERPRAIFQWQMDLANALNDNAPDLYFRYQELETLKQELGEILQFVNDVVIVRGSFAPIIKDFYDLLEKFVARNELFFRSFDLDNFASVQVQGQEDAIFSMALIYELLCHAVRAAERVRADFENTYSGPEAFEGARIDKFDLALVLPEEEGDEILRGQWETMVHGLTVAFKERADAGLIEGMLKAWARARVDMFVWSMREDFKGSPLVRSTNEGFWTIVPYKKEELLAVREAAYTALDESQVLVGQVVRDLMARVERFSELALADLKVEIRKAFIQVGEELQSRLADAMDRSRADLAA